MKTSKAIQYIDSFASKKGASVALSFLSSQIDYRGGRVLDPTLVNPFWRVQAFFEMTPEIEAGMPLPDGCRVVTAIVGRCGFVG